MDTPGIKVVPIHLMGESNINQVFYEDVRVPATHRGSARRTRAGGSSPTSSTTSASRSARRASSSARSTRSASGRSRRRFPTAAASSTRSGCSSAWPASTPRLEFLRLINWKIAWASTQRALHPADASATKVFGTEFYLEAFRLLMEIIGQRAYLKDGLARRRAAGAARAPVPRPDHPHLRRRHQRGAARPDRRVRPRHAPRATLARSRHGRHRHGLLVQRRAGRPAGPGEADLRG